MRYTLIAFNSYSFINTYDSAAHQATGTYASHMIMHDFYTKTYQEVDFNYHDNYNEELHTDSFRQNKPYNERFPISTAPIDYDQLSVSDYPKSRISLLPTSRFLHNEDTGIFGVQPQSEGLLEAKRVSQQNSIANGIKLEMIVGINESKNKVDWIFSFLAEYTVRACEFPNIESIWAMPAIPKK